MILLTVLLLGGVTLISWLISIIRYKQKVKDLYIAAINSIPMNFTKAQYVVECEFIEMIYARDLSSRWMRKQSYKRFKKLYGNEVY